MKGLPEQQAREQETRTALLRTQELLADIEKQAHRLSTQEQLLEKLAAASIRAMRKDDLARQLTALERASKELLQLDAQLTQLEVFVH